MASSTRSNTDSGSSSVYDVALDELPASPGGVDNIGLGNPYMPSPRDAARNGHHPMRYAFAQAFGEQMPTATQIPLALYETDIISSVRFNRCTDMVATGDRGGRIVILKRAYGLEAKRLRNRRGRSKGQGNLHPLSPRPHSYDPNVPSASHNSAGDSQPPFNEEESDDDNHQSDRENRIRDELGNRVEPPEFHFWTQFQSHEPEFDYLKSMEIEEKINHIEWCRESSGAQRLVATNDKTIKLWRVYEKEVKTLATIDPQSLLQPRQRPSPSRIPQSPQTLQSPPLTSHQRNPLLSSVRRAPYSYRQNTLDPANVAKYTRDAYQLRIPKLEVRARIVTASPRRVFSNAHTYHINSISLNSDEETFLSADDLRINLWNLSAGGIGFNILDIKPTNMEDLTEVITAAEFHPKHCHLSMHSSSRGVVRLSDLRMSALCRSWARVFEEPEVASSRTSFFSEIITSISDIKFSPDGRYILTRDYMNLRLWDINMERAPVLVVPVHEPLRSRLCDLYENDCFFDKFECCFSSDGGSMLTGSYNSLFQSYSSHNGVGSAVEASVAYVSGLSGRHRFSPEGLSSNLIVSSSAQELVDPNRRIMFLDASSSEQIAAVAAGPALYLYSGMS